MKGLKHFIDQALTCLPPHRALIRAKEAELFQTAELKPPILDLGCGDGAFANIAFDVVIDTGVDILDTDLRRAEKLGVYQRVVNASAERLPFPERSFQTVISNCVLEHIPNLDGVLKEIHRVLSPQGNFYCTVVGENFNHWLLGTRLCGRAYTNYFNWHSHHFHTFRRDEWIKLLGDRGLQVTRCSDYFDRFTLKVFDILHYLSVPNLLTKALFNRWVILPQVQKNLYQGLFESLLSREVQEGSYYFFEAVRL